jgi:hypothetical protein
MHTVTYQLQLNDGTERRYQVDIERPYRLAERNAEDHPPWTRLENHRCSNCCLDAGQHRYCPAALEFEEIAQHFANTASIERADVWVHTQQRSYFKNSDMQTMLKSLFGLIMASGACPILSRLKPLAHSHLPFANLEETVQRLVGTYLINQYLKQYDGTGTPDWELKGVQELYRELKIVNLALMKRIREASKEDASVNAIQTFISITSIVEMGIDDIIGKMTPALRKGL